MKLVLSMVIFILSLKAANAVQYGDIRLDDSRGGLVLLYLGPDGTDIESMWGTLSLYGKAQNVAYTLCRQLGYLKGEITMNTQQNVKPTVPVWLYNINCGKDDYHILWCRYKKYEANYTHGEDMLLTCDTSIGYRNPKDPSMADGELALFPINDINASVSFGMVAIKCGKEGGDWKFISVDDSNSLSRNLLDTVCRGLGYTNAVPNSARTLEYYRDKLSYTFLNTDHVTSHFDATNINCATSYHCIRCCLNNEDLGYCQDGSRKRSLSDVRIGVDKALVIGCSFYNLSGEIESDSHHGKRDFCEIKAGNQDNCPNGDRRGGADYGAAFGVTLFLFLVLLIVVITVIIKVKVIPKFKRDGYMNILNGGPDSQ